MAIHIDRNPFREYIDLWLSLLNAQAAADVAGRDDSAYEEQICDHMDAPWWAMSNEDQKAAGDFIARYKMHFIWKNK